MTTLMHTVWPIPFFFNLHRVKMMDTTDDQTINFCLEVRIYKVQRGIKCNREFQLLSSYIHTQLITPRWGFSEPMKPTTEMNLTG